MATKIVTKNSSTASAVPTASDLVQGELAVNVADKRLFTEDNAGAIVELGTNPSGNVTFQDNGKAIFGAGSDLQIYHDGSNSYISEVGTGELVIQARDAVTIEDGTSGDNYMYMQRGNKVSLFYAGAEKLATTATGIDVTGTATMDGLNVDGTITAYGLNFDVSDGVEINALESIVFDIDSDNNQTNRVFQVKANNSTPLFTIQEAGNVLIGTSSSAAKLTVGTFGDTARAAQFHGGSILIDGAAATDLIMGDGNVAYMSLQTTDNATAMKIRDYSGNADLVTVERASGNVGIGMTPSKLLDIQATDNLALRFYNSTSFKAGLEVATTAGDMIAGSAVNDLAIRSQTNMLFATGGNTERLRISSAGRVGIGVSSLNNPLEVGVTPNTASKTSGSAFDGAAIRLNGNLSTTNSEVSILAGADNHIQAGIGFVRESANDWGSAIKFYTRQAAVVDLDGIAERMRIDSSGYVKASSTGSYINTGGAYHETIGSGSGICYYILNSNSNGDGVIINTKNDSTNHYFLRGYSDSTFRDNIYIYSNGDILNRNNSYGGFSDQNLKQDIEDASSQWEDVKAMKFRKYRWKQDVAADADAPYQLGVIAQELESAGMNGLVEETADKEFYDEVFLDEDGNPVVDEDGSNVTTKKERLTGESTKSVKYSILTMKALKALQEAMDRIETLESRVTELENN